jgi:hypothetical protein
LLETEQNLFPPTTAVNEKVLANLAAFKQQYVDQNLSIRIEVESNSTGRIQVAKTLGRYLVANTLGYYEESTWTGRFPDYAITVRYCGGNKKQTDDLLKAIKPYISAGDSVGLIPINNLPPGTIMIYLNGTPYFDNQGCVKIQ